MMFSKNPKLTQKLNSDSWGAELDKLVARGNRDGVPQRAMLHALERIAHAIEVSHACSAPIDRTLR